MRLENSHLFLPPKNVQKKAQQRVEVGKVTQTNRLVSELRFIFQKCEYNFPPALQGKKNVTKGNKSNRDGYSGIRWGRGQTRD